MSPHVWVRRLSPAAVICRAIAPRNQTLSSCVSTHSFGSKEKNHGKLRAYDDHWNAARPRDVHLLLLHVLLTHRAR